MLFCLFHVLSFGFSAYRRGRSGKSSLTSGRMEKHCKAYPLNIVARAVLTYVPTYFQEFSQRSGKEQAHESTVQARGGSSETNHSHVGRKVYSSALCVPSISVINRLYGLLKRIRVYTFYGWLCLWGEQAISALGLPTKSSKRTGRSRLWRAASTTWTWPTVPPRPR